MSRVKCFYTISNNEPGVLLNTSFHDHMCILCSWLYTRLLFFLYQVIIWPCLLAAFQWTRSWVPAKVEQGVRTIQEIHQLLYVTSSHYHCQVSSNFAYYADFPIVLRKLKTQNKKNSIVFAGNNVNTMLFLETSQRARDVRTTLYGIKATSKHWNDVVATSSSMV